MCGIAGFLGFPLQTDPETVLRDMTQTLAHRGPDDAGLWLDQAAGIALGHRRLAIVDLSTSGHQPMQSACGRFVCVFNGEIYNHLSLRARLEHQQAGHNWRGHSDTETLLACFAHWGIEHTLQQTVGMFALALWDKRERLLYLLRDRMGEKPLYYGWVNGCFAFASELKAFHSLPGFLPEIDRQALASYLRFAYVPAPASIYQGIHKLPAGHYLVLRAGVKHSQPPELRAWWSLPSTAHLSRLHPVTDEQEALHLLKTTLTEATRLQACADSLSFGRYRLQYHCSPVTGQQPATGKNLYGRF
ncbi:MAG: hypothetical protein R3E95_00955 [Thiolinea sp.]